MPLFLNGQRDSGRGERGSMFTRPKTKRKPGQTLEDRETLAESLLEASGGIPEATLTGLERVTDILLRPNYSVAGAMEEYATTQDVQAALKRAGTEFFSGMGGLEGQKETMSSALEAYGVPEMGHLSSLAPFLYNETGKGWRFKQGGLLDLTGRGAVGFGLDVPMDPLTYVSFGTAHTPVALVRKAGKVIGHQRFSRKGLKAVAEAYDAEAPEATRLANRLLTHMRKKSKPEPIPEEVASLPGISRRSPSRVRLEGQLDLAKRELAAADAALASEPLDTIRMAAQQRAAARVADIDRRLNTRAIVEEFVAQPRPSTIRSGLNGVEPEEALRWAREQQVLASEIAHQNAVTQVHDLINRGSTQYADDSVVRFAGRTLLSNERFKKIGAPVSRFLRHTEELPIAGQIMAGIRKINDSRARKALAHGLDSAFNETLRAARSIPGALEARTLFRAEARNFRKYNLESVGKLSKGLRKMKLAEPVQFAGRTIDNVGEYVGLHLDDPVRFPKEHLPPEVIDRIPSLRAMSAEWFRNEARVGAIDPKAFRDNYFTHIFDNTDEEIQALSERWAGERGIPFDKTFMRGPWGESRVFPTLTDAVEYAARLKQEGVINFELKPVLDVGEVLAKRGDSNALAMAANRYHTRVINNMGLSPEKVAEETFRRTFPEIASKLRDRIQAGISESFGEGAAIDALFPNGRIDGLTVGQLLAAAERGLPLPKPPRRARTRRGGTPSLGESIRQEVPLYPTKGRPARDPGQTPGFTHGEVPLRPEPSIYGQKPPRQMREAYTAPEHYGEEIIRPVSDFPAGRATTHGPTPSLGEEIKRSVPIYGDQTAGRPSKRPRVKPAGYSPAVQALYWMGRMTAVKDLASLEKLIKRHGDDIRQLDTHVLEDIRNLIGVGRRKYLAEFNSPYVRVDSGPYQGMYLPQGMAEEAARIGTSIVNKREVGQFLKTWDFVQDFFKTHVTSPWPAFHIRNAMSNVATTFTDLGMSAFNPRRMGTVASIMLGRDGTLHTESGRRYTHHEIRQLAENYGLWTPASALGEQLGRKEPFALPGTRTYIKGSRRVGQKIEDHAKLINFVTWLERGLDPASAAQRVHKTLFDYDQLAPFERDVMRRLFPFYTWTSKNLRLMTEQILRHPGRIKAQLMLGGQQDQGPERELLPNYLRGDFKLKMKHDGKLTYVTGLDLPITSAIETALGANGRNVLQQNLSSITPALKIATELGFRRELWTGKSLDERADLGAFGQIVKALPEPMKEWLEFQEMNAYGEPGYSMNGLKAYLFFKSYFLSRMFSTGVKFETDSMKSFLVDFFTNVELKEFELSEAQERALRNRVREMEAELVKRGVLQKGRPYLPKKSPFRE